jgi:hypothetical protein
MRVDLVRQFLLLQFLSGIPGDENPDPLNCGRTNLPPDSLDPRDDFGLPLLMSALKQR